MDLKPGAGSLWPTSLIAAKATVDRWTKLRRKNELKHKNRDPDTLQECVRASLTINGVFKGFSRENTLRQRFFRIYKSPVWSTFFLIVAAANAVSIAVAPALVADFNSGNNGESNTSNAAVFANVFDLLCFFVLTSEIIIGIVALGGWDGPRYALLSICYKLDNAHC